MLALQLSQKWFEEYGHPMLLREFPDEINRIAVGMVGHGSESFGFDDTVSQDHDYRIGFMLWLTDEDDARFGFQLARAYSNLMKEHPPREFSTAESALGETEYGVSTIADFYRRHTGLPHAPANWQEWLNIPDYALAEATNGLIFMDELGEFSKIREMLLNGMPEDVRLKKLAAHCVMAAQSGQYNFVRCINHKEEAAAQLALADFVNHAMHILYLLNRRYAPYYKWIFRGARNLPILSEVIEPIAFTMRLSLENPKETAYMIDNICGEFVKEFQKQGLTDITETYLEPQAFQITERIQNISIKSLHVMDGI